MLGDNRHMKTGVKSTRGGFVSRYGYLLMGLCLTMFGCGMSETDPLGRQIIESGQDERSALLGRSIIRDSRTLITHAVSLVDGPPNEGDSPPAGDDEDEPPLCLIECDDRECGDNGCGGLCGMCGQGEACSGAGLCEAPTPDCTPQCFRNTCGDDGCGGQCGQCIEGASCTAYESHRNTSRFTLCEADEYELNNALEVCPPSSEDMGSEVGDVVPEIALLECGSFFPVNHRGMCGHSVSITYQINVNCGPCIGYVNSVLGPLQNEFGSDGVQFYVVYTGADECDTSRYFRDGAEHIKFVFPPMRHAYSHLFGTGGRASTLILGEGNRIEYYGKGDGTNPNGPSSDMLRGHIEAALNP